MTYQTWIHHGEQPSDHVFNVEAPPPLPANHVLNEDAPVSRLHDLFTETLGRAVGVNNFENFHNNSDCPSGDDIEDGSGGNNQDRADVNDVNYNKQLQDAAQPLYLGCSAEHTKLSTTVCLLSMKARYQCSDVFMTMLLGYLKTILPAENTLPDNCRKAKDMIKPFQFPVQIIHACINDCILYRKDYADLEECPKCKESRWKQPPEGSIPTTRKLSVKILRYFPVTERLQRMYSVPWIAELMIWYSKVVESATHMRHPVDSSQWKSIDRKWPEFCEEKRHVRLGLETDGFNPPMTDFHG
ncbi:uncharacterized protein LOC113294426 [Papaver somniferum]|uniref:uncharacterized protein LOC113294426 n=1 Tax=Papaver somniferum TaxID=3469 RepID=UPI000E6F5803|nr:uncharacterized protein LOC113294426 [Papaver somniferum]